MEKKKLEIYKLTPAQIKTRIIILVVLIILGILSIYGNLKIGVTYYTYSNDKIPSTFDGLRIVQISDFHNSNFGPSGSAVANEVKELNPDIIVITGDFIDSRNTNMDKSIEFAKLLTDIAPTYYINGNHELRFDTNTINGFYNSLREAGVTVLIDSSILLNKNGTDDYINLIGLDDANKNYLQYFDTDTYFNIVLAHEPQDLHSYAYNGADLIFSGHAHGGQIRIPFTDIGLVAPDQGIFPRLTSGMHVDGNTTMIISRGIGNSAIPIRVFNNPEIVVVDFEC